ncbi:sodium ion-translocating decarboxylase subunit beta [Chloroflexota bacterium]
MFGLETGFGEFFTNYQYPVMVIIGLVLIYLGISKKMEPLLLVPIGLGVILVNLPWPNEGLMAYEVLNSSTGALETIPYHLYVLEPYNMTGGEPVGLMSRIFQYGLTWEIIPPLIFLGLGAMTDFGPVIANPKTLLLGAGAQFGVYFALIIAFALGVMGWLPFQLGEAASIGIIGGADGPTTIFVTNRLAPAILGATAVAAYSYMALVPIIQPPIIKLLTSKKQRQIYMKPQLRKVSNREKIIFPLMATIVIILLVPASAPLVGCFMLGNLLMVSGVTERLAKTAGGEFMNILTILLGVAVGAQMSGFIFLSPKTLGIFALGLVAFMAATAFGVILAQLMNLVSKHKINPMIGAAGVSAVPMAARVVQTMGQKENPRNFLLMHAMGPNIAGVIGTAVAAGVFISMIS